MTTTCWVCRAPLAQRVHLVVHGCGEQLPLFAETYRCGAVRLWGLVEGDGVARSCPMAPPRPALPGLPDGADGQPLPGVAAVTDAAVQALADALDERAMHGLPDTLEELVAQTAHLEPAGPLAVPHQLQGALDSMRDGLELVPRFGALLDPEGFNVQPALQQALAEYVARVDALVDAVSRHVGST